MTWLWSNLDLVAELTLVHLALSVPAIILSFVISVPIGWLAHRYRWSRAVLLSLCALLYAVPSLALFVALPPITGLALQPQQLLLQFGPHDGIDRAERLVHEQDVGVDRESARDADALLLPARELVRLVVLAVDQPHQREQAVDLLPVAGELLPVDQQG